MANMFVKRQDLRKRQLTDRERIQEDVKKEDFLIRQIDEFKDKAKQLQQLLDAKESRVQELQGIVEEREKRARGLQEILKEKQLEVDNITKGVEGYANQIARELAGRIGKVEDCIKEQAAKEQELGEIRGILAGRDAKLRETQGAYHMEKSKLEALSNLA